MDYGKLQYQQSKNKRKQKAKSKKTELKITRFSLRTGEHDLNFKVKQAIRFLQKGHKLQIEIVLRGREKTLFNLAHQKIQDFIQKLNQEIEIQKTQKKLKSQQSIKRSGRGLTTLICLK